MATAAPVSLSRSKGHSRRAAAGRRRLLLAAAAVCFIAACGPKRQPPAPPSPAAPVPPPRQNLFVLLPEEGGRPSAIVVRNSAGESEISQPRQVVRVESATRPPSAPASLDQAEIDRIFGAAIAALPPPELRFVLNFELNSEAPTAESSARIPEIIAAIRERRSTAVTIIGHTDATGTTQANYQLGLRRAQRIADALREAGLDPAHISVSSHGDADPVVAAARGTPEPRNRRVEVVVR